MAVPSYTNDLTDIDLAETTTGYVAYGGGGAGLGVGADFSMQGINCVDKQITSAEKGILFNNGVGITMGSGDHTWIWHFTATPGVTDSLVNRGAVVNIGSGTTAFVKYHVEGLETFGAGGRVGKCYTIDQTVQTSNTGSVPYRTLVGSPSGTLQYFGSGLNTTATVRSSNMGLDATRYGKGGFITAGEIANPATFNGFSVQNDSISNRWGILTDLGGSFELQGMFAIGQNNAGTATLAYFKDNDIAVNLADTVHSAADFTQFVIDHASTEVYWTNINITALGTNNKGKIVVNTTPTAFDIVGGTFTGLGTTTLQTNCTADGVTWRNTDSITLNSANITNCLIENNIATAAAITDDLNDITDCTFNSSGTKHAIELTSIGGGSMAWDNIDSGYAGTDGSTGNETIFVNVATGSLTINVGAGYTTPTIRTAGATVTVVSGQVTTLLTVKDSEGAPIQNARVRLTVKDGTNFPYKDTVTITSSGTTATVTHAAHGLSTNDNIKIEDAVESRYNGNFNITFIDANTYTYIMSVSTSSPATGTILATFSYFNDLTDISGQVTDTRSISVNQEVEGWARKGSVSPLYKEKKIDEIINSTNGLTLNIELIDDE